MSRGPGRLQAKILEDLSREPGGRLPWRWLRGRYPKATALSRKAKVNLVRYADDCAPRRREGSGTGPDPERHAA